MNTETSELLTDADLRERLQEEIKTLGSQKAWALKYGVSPAYVNDLINGRRNISDELAKSLGFQRTAKQWEPMRQA